MKRYKVLWRVLKRTGVHKLLYGYLFWLVLVSVALVFIEPQIHTVREGLWYSFTVLSTIGFGDILAVTPAGRLLTILLSVYSILIIAVIPGIIASFYMEIVKMKTNESMEKFMLDLERLPELSQEELQALSKKVKEFNKRA